MSAVRVDVPITMLRAALLCAAKRDVRSYLEAVRIECAGGQGRVIATNGVCLFVGRFDSPDVATAAAILPRRMLDAAEPEMKDAREGAVARVVLDPDCVSIALECVTYSAKPLDAQYMDWRAVIPTAVDGQPAVHQPRIWGIFTRCARLLRVLHPVIMPNGKRAGLGALGEDALFVAMPLRDVATFQPPAWATARVAQMTAVADAAVGEGAPA